MMELLSNFLETLPGIVEIFRVVLILSSDMHNSCSGPRLHCQWSQAQPVPNVSDFSDRIITQARDPKIVGVRTQKNDQI